jgi:hypothetical protein
VPLSAPRPPRGAKRVVVCSAPLDSLFQSDRSPCFSLLSIYSKKQEVPGFRRLFVFSIIFSLFFSKITLFLAK